MKKEEILAEIEKVKNNKFLPENLKQIKINQLTQKLPKDEAEQNEEEQDFEAQLESAPTNVKKAIQKAYGDEDSISTDELKALNTKLNSKGWEIDYGLDGVITSLTKIKSPGKKERKKRVSKKSEIKKIAGFYKLKNPENLSEKKLIFKISNFNEVTGKCYITPINSDMEIPPEELVNFDELVKINPKEKTIYKFKGKGINELNDEDCADLIKQSKERREKAAKAEKKSKSRPIIEKVTVPIVKSVKKAIENIPAADLKDKPKTELSRIDKAIAATKRYLMELKSILGEDFDKDTVEDEMKDLHALSKELHKKYGE